MAWVINWGGVGSLWGSGISASGAWWLTPGVSGGRGGTHVAGQVWGGLAQTLHPPLGFQQRFI